MLGILFDSFWGVFSAYVQGRQLAVSFRVPGKPPPFLGMKHPLELPERPGEKSGHRQKDGPSDGGEGEICGDCFEIKSKGFWL